MNPLQGGGNPLSMIMGMFGGGGGGKGGGDPMSMISGLMKQFMPMIQGLMGGGGGGGGGGAGGAGGLASMFTDMFQGAGAKGPNITGE